MTRCKKSDIENIVSSLPEETSIEEVMEKLYAETGADFSLTRTTIGSTDFSVEGNHSHAEVEGDAALKHFNINENHFTCSLPRPLWSYGS